METKGLYLWLLGLLAFASSAGCLEAVVGEAGDCAYDGKVYRAGDHFQASDGCNTCRCGEGGEVACTGVDCAPTCMYDGKLHPRGQSFPARDGCNTCSCAADGTVSCTEIACSDAGPTTAGRCTHAGKSYEPGVSFPASDGCNTCTCAMDGTVSCTDRACGTGCAYEGRMYGPNDSFLAKDGCNTCKCGSDGQAECTLRACAPICQKDGKTYDVGDTVPGGEQGQTCTCGMLGEIFCRFTTCEHEGTTYKDGALFRTPDGCSICTCRDGKLECFEDECVPPATCMHQGKAYAANETFEDTTSCSSCTCMADGTVVCTPHACDPSWSCRFGSTTFGHGANVICPDGCNECLCANGMWASTDAACPALSRVEICDEVPPDVTKATTLYLEGDALALQVHLYGCTNERPGYKLCWDGSFAESSPAQTRVYVVPTEPASCMEWLTLPTVFDLSPIRAAYGQFYPMQSGPIGLNVHGVLIDYAF